MSAGVKRRYDNSRREAVVRATRAAVVAAARALFIEAGYSATTIESISDACRVPLGTVYRLFGSKRGILLSVLDVAFGGDDQPVAYRDRPATQRALAEPDPHRLIEAFSPLSRELLERSAPILHLLRSAAEADPEAAELYAEAQRQRYAGQSNLAQVLAERDQLAVTAVEAADIMYTLRSPEVFRTLTQERGWSAEQYERWLTTALQATLLYPRARRRQNGSRRRQHPVPATRAKPPPLRDGFMPAQSPTEAGSKATRTRSNRSRI
jgi:AcrR family transcriptional regulator